MRAPQHPRGQNKRKCESDKPNRIRRFAKAESRRGLLLEERPPVQFLERLP